MKDFEMTHEQLKELKEAFKPTPVMNVTSGQPIFKSPQENANCAWEKLGKELGFNHLTVRPKGKDPRFFTAEPV